MVTGRKPWREESLDLRVAVAVAVEGCRLDIPREGFPEPLADLVRACWASDPSHRPGFKDGVVPRLERFLETCTT